MGDSIHLGANAVGAYVSFPGTPSLATISIDNGIMGSADITMSGSWLIGPTGNWDGYGQHKTFDVGDNVIHLAYITYPYRDNHLIMRGSGVVHDVTGGTATQPEPWESLTIATGASVMTGSGYGAAAKAQKLIINGDIAGGNWWVMGSHASVEIGPGGTMSDGVIVLDDYTNSDNIEVGGGTYREIRFGGSTYGSGLNRTVRFKGNVATTNDFNYMETVAYYTDNRHTVVDTDNGNGTDWDLTVGGNFSIGQNPSANNAAKAGFKANSSTIDIAGSSTFGLNGYVVGGTSTWKFGGNVQVTSDFNYGDTDMSQATVVIDGAGDQNLDIGSKVPLGNVVIAKSGGGLTLDDNVLLVGNLSITGPPTSFTITNATDGIIFKGGVDCETLAQTIDVGGADLLNVTIAAGSNTYVKLLSDLAISDNLNIETGSKLFLGTHTLDLTGSDAAAYLGQNVLSGAGVWTLAEGGEIVGVIPEPGTMLLLGTGLIGAFGYVRRRRMS